MAPRRILRIAIGLVVVGVAFGAGFSHRSPWMIVLLGASFAGMYLHSKGTGWRRLRAGLGAGGAALNLAATVLVQTVLAGVLFLLGLGLGTLMTNQSVTWGLTLGDLVLVSVVLAIGFGCGALTRPRSQRGQAAGDDDLSPTMQQILVEAVALSEQETAMPAQIFALAHRIAQHGDTLEALAVLDGALFDDSNAFVRRVAMTALRRMGQAGRDGLPEEMDGRIIAGMEDASPWVRYDAAWAAGELRGNDQAYAAALTRMIEQAEREAHTYEDGSAERKALDRARTSLVAVRQRLQRSESAKA